MFVPIETVIEASNGTIGKVYNGYPLFLLYLLPARNLVASGWSARE